jgi:hypothetical protein
MTKAEQASGTHGYEVTVKVRTGMASTDLRTFVIAGTQSRVRQKAQMKSNVIEVVSMKSISTKDWRRAYGDARIRM